ncbi:hypothetical protein [Lactobacillus sp. S2-2]|uniref:hypothetical protein n=1 Tax=Lactobacillus sp. S2-2 TaxID=2692917 RepID=UPI001F3D47B1|nr:hypothetical protein [Lactobacillus sp. S2-2]
MDKIIKGSGFTSENPNKIEFLENVLLIVTDGYIEKIINSSDKKYEELINKGKN